MVGALVLALSLLAATEEATGAPETAKDLGPYAIAWGGTSLSALPGGSSVAAYGAEAGYSLPALDVGLVGYGYDNLYQKGKTAPVFLARLGERFEWRRGLEASVLFGAGAARLSKWQAWFQAAFGLRWFFGRLFIEGELSFEENDLVRLDGGLGVRF